MAINLKKLKPAQIDALSAQIEEHKKSLRQTTIAALKAKIAEMAKAEGIGMDELFPRHRGTAKKGQKVAQKYWNPSDHSQTWSGRGRQPLWYVQAVKAGRTERALLIK